VAIAEVSSQRVGTSFNASSSTITLPNQVTNGNVVMLMAQAECDAANGIGTPTVGLHAGSSCTIGTPVVDATYAPDLYRRLSIVRIPVTGSGSMTLDVNCSANAQYCTIAADEFSGMEPSNPVDGSLSTGTGSTSPENSGNAHSSATGGMIIGLTQNNSTSTVTFSGENGTVIYEQGSSAYATGCTQFRLVDTGDFNLQDNISPNFTWFALAQGYKTTVSSSNQKTYPSSDISVGGYLNELGSTPLYTSIDEVSPSTTDYVISPVDPSDQRFTVKFGSLGDPSTGTEHYIFFQYWNTDGVGQIDMTVYLKQGASYLGSFIVTDIPWVATIGTYAIPSTIVDTISDYTDLRAEISFNKVR
jgi:hypothetical protein